MPWQLNHNNREKQLDSISVNFLREGNLLKLGSRNQNLLYIQRLIEIPTPIPKEHFLRPSSACPDSRSEILRLNKPRLIKKEIFLAEPRIESHATYFPSHQLLVETIPNLAINLYNLNRNFEEQLDRLHALFMNQDIKMQYIEKAVRIFNQTIRNPPFLSIDDLDLYKIAHSLKFQDCPNCKYFSGNDILKCAVNPTGDSASCPDFNPLT